jgi:hypothetical protein
MLNIRPGDEVHIRQLAYLPAQGDARLCGPGSRRVCSYRVNPVGSASVRAEHPAPIGGILGAFRRPSTKTGSSMADSNPLLLPLSRPPRALRRQSARCRATGRRRGRCVRHRPHRTQPLTLHTVMLSGYRPCCTAAFAEWCERRAGSVDTIASASNAIEMVAEWRRAGSSAPPLVR